MTKAKIYKYRKFISLALSIVIVMGVFLSMVHSKSGVLDPVIEETTTGTDEALTELCSRFIDALTDSFSPSFFIYERMSAGVDDGKATRKELEKIDSAHSQYIADLKSNMANGKSNTSVFENNYIVRNIFDFAQKFGVALATLMVLFGLYMCLVGKSEQIKDSPVMLVLKYAVALFLIYMAKEIILTVMDVVFNIWNDFVVKGWSGENKLSYADIAVAGDSILAPAKEIGGSVRVYTGAMNLGIRLGGWFLKLKLLKNMFRLYVEIAERYFVMTIMLFFFPAIAPTMISNQTSNITHSYIRMFISQVFLFCANIIFMKVFVICIQTGAFTRDLLGYVCGLGYIKVCTRLDQYMAQMGMSVAQCGSGMINSAGGALIGAASLLRAGRSAAKVVNKGIEKSRTQGFEQAIAARDDIKAAAYNEKLGNKVTPDRLSSIINNAPTAKETYKGNAVTAPKDGFYASATSMGVNRSTVNAIQQAPGYASANKVTIKQLDGSSLPSHNAGSLYQVTDSTDAKNEKPIATVANGSVITPTSLSNDSFSDSTFIQSFAQTISGSKDGEASDFRYDENTKSGSFTINKDGATYDYSFVDVGTSPEAISSKDSHIVAYEKTNEATHEINTSYFSVTEKPHVEPIINFEEDN